MYEEVKSHVKYKAQTSEKIVSSIGVKQGDSLSSLLCSVFS